MKTLTITLHDTDNCGSSLQAFALQHFLIKNGIENEIIDYVPKYTQNNGKPLKHFLRTIVFWRASREKYRKFKVFKEKYLKVTKDRYETYSQLESSKLFADCFIAGSDQLWNDMYLCGQDPAFYLNFTNLPKIAYAVSMGREHIPKKNKSLVTKYANSFQWISFREKSSPGQFKSDVKCPLNYVCDPVLLNPIMDYDAIKADPIITEPYILIYIAQAVDRDMVDNLILKLRKKYLGEVVCIGVYRSKCKCNVHMKDTSPEEFLSLISNAQCIVSNSFHATVFSIMYKKQFMTIIPNENGERIKMILEVAGLSKNAVYDTTNVNNHWISPEEYFTAEGKLSEFFVSSQNLLLKYLNEINQFKG